MAIKQVNKGAAIPELVCQNADVASLPTANVPAGAKCWVSDTGIVLKFNGSAWVPYSQPVSVTGSLPNMEESQEVTINGKVLVAAGKKTDAANGVDKTIATAGFNRISIINDGPAELHLAINESAITGAKIIYISDGEAFESDTAGTVLHYTILNDLCTFRYVLQ